MNKINIKNLGLPQLLEQFSQMGLEGFRLQQVKKWLYQKQVKNFGEMTNLKRALQQEMERHFVIPMMAPKTTQLSEDGTKKYLFELEDGKLIESVLIPSPDRLTLCVSSQAGCAMGCQFCLTATMGLLRNLTIYEIVDQVGAVSRDLSPSPPPPPLEGGGRGRGSVPRRLTNLVFMGMGEPLANTKNLYSALEILLDPLGYNFSRQHITVSTSGLAPQIEKFGHQTPVKLAISLNATTDKVRDEIMPINRKYPLERLLEACQKMHLPKRNRITFEYVMLHGVNDTGEDAKRLVTILSKLKAKINLIPFNEYPGSPFRRPSDEWVFKFQKVLLDKGFVANIRKSRGRDILGACGQLATKTS